MLESNISFSLASHVFVSCFLISIYFVCFYLSLRIYLVESLVLFLCNMLVVVVVVLLCCYLFLCYGLRKK